MKRFHIALFRYLSTLWVSGAVALALATWACVLLGLSSATAACVYLIIIVLLSLMDSFVTAVIFPVIAVGCLDFFFIKPLFAFEVANAQDLTTLSAFLITSVANAEACLGWLDRESPDLNEAHAAIERIVRDGHRAGEVIRRVRALIKRTDTQIVPLDVNE